MKSVRRLRLKWFVLMMSIVMIGTGSTQAEPGPFENFFHKLKRAFSEPQQQKSTRRSSHKQTDETTNPSTEASTTPAASGDAAAPPTERNTRTATRATSKKGDDLRYGTPVPGKTGFVTSPFSPQSGYIDVRGFAPGTPVKDPYTGKIFLTP
jgi:hypothetical protein